jgi:hypothetical protein
VSPPIGDRSQRGGRSSTPPAREAGRTRSQRLLGLISDRTAELFRQTTRTSNAQGPRAVGECGQGFSGLATHGLDLDGPLGRSRWMGIGAIPTLSRWPSTVYAAFLVCIRVGTAEGQQCGPQMIRATRSPRHQRS